MRHEIAESLAQLDSAWTVIRSSDLDDADFVVIGPAGVFTISSESAPHANIWADEEVIWVNGRPSRQVENSRMAALAVSTKLTLATGEVTNVIPIVAVSDPKSVFFGGDHARRVIVLTADGIAQWLSECSRAYSDNAVAFLSAFAEDSTTWAEQAR